MARAASLGGCVGALLGGLALAACGPPPTPEGLVKKMSDRLAQARAFSFSTSEKHERRKGEGKVEVAFSREFSVRRPDRLAFRVKGGEREAAGMYDGKSFTLVWPGEQAWARVRMPETIDRSLDRLAEHFQVAMPVGDLLYSAPYDVLVGPGVKGRIVGQEAIEGRECDQLAFAEEKVDWQIWIARGADPLPCQIEITTKGRSGPLTSRVTFRSWNLAAALDDSAFAAQVPEGYERVMMLAHEPEAAAPPAEEAK